MRLINGLALVLLKLPITLPPRYGYKALALAALALLVAAIRASGMHLILLRQAAHAVLQMVGPE